MRTPARRRRSRRRKCRHCQELYTPDPRNRWHQKYCSKPGCRAASKRAAQQRWLASDKGAGYFQNPENVARVQQWRAAHPGYWRRVVPETVGALQDPCSSQPVGGQGVTCSLTSPALQDLSTVQPALLIGLIASLTGTTLQDDIAETTRRLVVSGRDILGSGLESPSPGGRRNG
jgi:hypothetical protein